MRRLLIGAGLAFLVLSIAGGYGLHWEWTGYPGNTLWDWLNLCLLPVVLSFLPLAYSMSKDWLLAVAGVSGALLVVLLVGGYGFRWAWTGFPGNTLWDWLHLMLLPIALPMAAHELGERQKRRDEAAKAAAEAEAQEVAVAAAEAVVKHEPAGGVPGSRAATGLPHD